jgi:serine/threonine protein kinase
MELPTDADFEDSINKLVDFQEMDPRKKYEMSAKLGQGGFGVVYKAKLKADGTDVALKVVTIRNDEVTVQSIRQEAGLMMLLKDAKNVI